ncbi:hypothetical protein LCGC14_1624040 [marine sediment metagenome]|uniref:Uncharacterized protein n=1 Tax=marine sediment metagenome TaxID=412755 RepID=A0A0F9L4A6_9ZZZZ
MTDNEWLGQVAARAYMRSRNRENAVALMIHDSEREITIEAGRTLWEAIDHYADVSPNEDAALDRQNP